jgi:thymidylate synthase (FAD)
MIAKCIAQGHWQIVAHAARRCYDSHSQSDSDDFRLGKNDLKLLHTLYKKGHHSVFEHMTYTFDIDGMSRACLQEFARHRIASLSVKSTRYTLKELKDAKDNELYRYITVISPSSIDALKEVRESLKAGMSNDNAKMMLPECFKTSLIWTINFRSLDNFFKLRMAPGAHFEIRALADLIYMDLDEVSKEFFDHWRS